jgi:cellulose biosynthesis protein BcsQ
MTDSGGNEDAEELESEEFDSNQIKDTSNCRFKEYPEDFFDFIIIDTAPTANIALMNASFAATEFIFPVDGSKMCLEGVETMLEHIKTVQFVEESQINFMILRARISRTDRIKIRETAEYCEARFPYNTAKTIIWEKRSGFSSAENGLMPISANNKSSEEAMFYKRFTQEVINNAI